MIRETELISLKDGKTKNLTEFVKDLAPTPEPMDLTPTTPVDTGGADPVALSSYIDGIADTSATDAISAGLASGGSIANAISSGASAAASAAITTGLASGGDIANAIDGAKSKFVHARTTSSITYAKSVIEQYDILVITQESISLGDWYYPPSVIIPVSQITGDGNILCDIYRSSSNEVYCTDNLKIGYNPSNNLVITKPMHADAINVMLIKF